MFAKIFGQIFDSSIAENPSARRTFIDLLILADSDGDIDMTFSGIAAKIRMPIEIVKADIEFLCQPDPESRSPEHEGRRLILLDAHRSWGWKIVNYQLYRSIRDEDARRAYFRDRQRAHRAKVKSVNSGQTPSNPVKDNERQSTKVTYAEGEGEGEEGGTHAREPQNSPHPIPEPIPPFSESPPKLLTPPTSPKSPPKLSQSQIISLEKELSRIASHLKTNPEPQTFNVSSGEFMQAGLDRSIARKSLLTRQSEIESLLQANNPRP